MTGPARNDDLGMIALEELAYQRLRLYRIADDWSKGNPVVFAPPAEDAA